MARCQETWPGDPSTRCVREAGHPGQHDHGYDPDERLPAVQASGDVKWPIGSQRDAFDFDLVSRADAGDDHAALELLHRDSMRATIAWRRFLGAKVVLPRDCVASVMARERG